MNVLQESFADFEVLGFPCNQFGQQEPGDGGEEILNGVKYVRPGGGFTPAFPLFRKVEVNGRNEHPIYTFLKSFCPATREGFVHPDLLYYEPLSNNDIRWNWEKFLITKNGKPYMRYDPQTKPEQIRTDILYLLQQDS